LVAVSSDIEQGPDIELATAGGNEVSTITTSNRNTQLQRHPFVMDS